MNDPAATDVVRTYEGEGLSFEFDPATAVLVGACIPVLVQLQWTLRSVRRTMERLEGRLTRSLDGLDRATARIASVGKEAEAATADIRKVTASVASLGSSLDEVGGSLKRAASLVSAVTPAVAAAVHAFLVAREKARQAPARDDEGAPEPDGGAEPTPTDAAAARSAQTESKS